MSVFSHRTATRLNRLSLPIVCAIRALSLYQPPLVLTHEEWVNGGRYRSHSARGRPPWVNPARDTSRLKWVGISGA